MKIIDNYSLLNGHLINLLNSSVSQPFSIGKFMSLDDVLNTLNVDVIIEPGVVIRPVHSALYDAENFWREEANRLKSSIPNAEDRESAFKDYREACKIAEEIHKEKELWTAMPLLGLYNPTANVIKLYPEEMMQEHNGSCMDEILVSTLAHETMHAYFNRPRHKSFPYVIFVEEPLAEFGMLLYLNETGSNYYDWAYKDVRSQKTCYRYGANLMDQHLNEGKNSSVRQYMEAYKIKLDNYPMPSIDPTDGTIILPEKVGRSNSPVQVGGHTITPHWQDIFKCPPRYFYDQTTKTLVLDGEWEPRGNGEFGAICVHYINLVDLNHIYLSDNFYLSDNINFARNVHDRFEVRFSIKDVIVSPSNKHFYTKSGVPFYKKNNTPVLPKLGDGLYKLRRNNKWGVVDAQLNPIVPFKYGSVYELDDNKLIMVNDGTNIFGLLNQKGEVQVPVIYKSIKDNEDGTYTVEKDGSEFVIDKFGNKI